MCHDTLRMPFTADHICETIRRLYSGKVIFHDGDAEIADGVTVHCVGGHSRGLQVVRVRTRAGWMVLASDAAHFYENHRLRKPFPIVVDVADMLQGFSTLSKLASHDDLVVPGHDPLVRQVFPRDVADHIVRLDAGPSGSCPGTTRSSWLASFESVENPCDMFATSTTIGNGLRTRWFS